MVTKKTESDASIKWGQVGFGQVGGYPPARWKFVGINRHGTYLLEHVPHPGQTPFSDQGVSREVCERIMRG